MDIEKLYTKCCGSKTVTDFGVTFYLVLFDFHGPEAAQARLSLHLSKCHIVGNHMSRLNFHLYSISLLSNESYFSVNPVLGITNKKSSEYDQ